MFRRIIKFDVKRNYVIKGKRYEGFRKIGLLEDLVKKYSAASEVEFFFYDVVATLFGINSVYEKISGLLEGLFLPACVGGGLHTEEQIRYCFESGVDRVALNFVTFQNPAVVERICANYGSQAVVGNVEARLIEGRWAAMHSTAREVGHRDLKSHIEDLQNMGVGEIIINAVDCDGMLSGFSEELLCEVSGSVHVPLILSGGFTSFERPPNASIQGIAISSALHYDKLRLQ